MDKYTKRTMRPGDRARSYCNAALELLNAEDFDAAARIFEKAAEAAKLAADTQPTDAPRFTDDDYFFVSTTLPTVPGDDRGGQ